MKIDEAQFTLKFTGSAVDGAIDVRHLAPALLAAADMVRAGRNEIAPNSPEPRIEIRATQEGSFIVQLAAVTASSLMDSVLDLLSSKEITAGATALAYLTPTIGAISFLVHARRKGVIDTTKNTDGSVQVTYTDNSVYIYPPGTVAVADRQDFRRASQDLTKPLDNQQVVSVEIESRDVPQVGSVTVRVDDAAAFDQPDPEPMVEERVGVFQIKQLSLDGDYKWRLSDGVASFTAAMTDLAFIGKIDRGEERFGKGDMLRARLRETLTVTPDGNLRAERVVIEVLDHVSVGQQLSIDLSPRKDDP